jgi:hypothetical protein
VDDGETGPGQGVGGDGLDGGAKDVTAGTDGTGEGVLEEGIAGGC